MSPSLAVKYQIASLWNMPLLEQTLTGDRHCLPRKGYKTPEECLGRGLSMRSFPDSRTHATQGTPVRVKPQPNPRIGGKWGVLQEPPCRLFAESQALVDLDERAGLGKRRSQGMGWHEFTWVYPKGCIWLYAYSWTGWFGYVFESYVLKAERQKAFPIKVLGMHHKQHQIGFNSTPTTQLQALQRLPHALILRGCNWLS